MKGIKKVLSLVLVLAMICTALSTLMLSAFAAEEECTHVFHTRIVPATETQDGYTVNECTLCGECFFGETIEATGYANEEDEPAYGFVLTPSYKAAYNISKFGINPKTGAQTSNATPFANLEFGDADYCIVDFVITNNTDGTLNEFNLANNFGTNCFLNETNAGLGIVYSYAKSGNLNIAPGATKTFTLRVPKDAYYSNAGKAITSDATGAADGGGHICNYTDVGIRLNFVSTAAPTQGTVTIASTNHPEINADLAAAFGSTALVESMEDLPKDMQSAYANRIYRGEGFNALSFENNGDATQFVSIGGTNVISSDKALIGTKSIKTVSANNWSAAGITALGTGNIVDGEGIYIFSGYIYIEALAASKSGNLQVRQICDNSNLYTTSHNNVSFTTAMIGKWYRFEYTVTMPGGKLCTDATSATTKVNWLEDGCTFAINGLADATYYLDGVMIEKPVSNAIKFTTKANNTATYVHELYNLGELADGTYNYTFRITNPNSFTIKAMYDFQVGWAYIKNFGAQGSKTIQPHRYLEFSKTLVIKNGKITDASNTEHDISDVNLRLDMNAENGGTLSGGVTFIVEQIGVDKVPGFEKTSCSAIKASRLSESDYVSYDLYETLPTGYDWSSTIVEPSCVTEGCVLWSFPDAKESQKIRKHIVPSLGGHISDEHEPDCTVGTLCTRCGEVLVPALAHTAGTIVKQLDATETAEGYIYAKCSECEAYYKEVIPATGTAAANFAKLEFRSQYNMSKFGTSYATPFKSFTNPTDDAYITVRFKIYNATDATLKYVGLSNYWGTTCYLDANKTAATGYALQTGAVAKGACADAVLQIPKAAYYSNNGNIDSTDTNGGGGVLCSYKDVGLRVEFTSTPTSGALYIYDNDALTSGIVSSAWYESSKKTLTAAPEELTYAQGIQADGSYLVSGEGVAWGSDVKGVGGYTVTQSTEQVFAGEASIKVSGGKYAYQSFGVGSSIGKIINEEGVYNVSGWIYFETLPDGGANTGLQLNLRCFDTKYYQTYSASLKCGDALGKWMPFSWTMKLPAGVATSGTSLITDKNNSEYFLNQVSSLSLDGIGNGSVYYIDDFRIEKATVEPTTYVMKYTSEKVDNQAYYTRWEQTYSTLSGDGEHSFTYRLINPNDFDLYAQFYIQNDWAAMTGCGGVQVTIKANSYHDITYKFTVSDDGTKINGNTVTDLKKITVRTDVSAVKGKNIGAAKNTIYYLQEIATNNFPSLATFKAVGPVSATGVINSTLDSSKEILNTISGYSLVHPQEEIPAVPATCTSTGMTAGSKCEICGEVSVEPTVAQIDPNAHKYNDVVTPMTETTEGYTTHTCEYCFNSYVDTYTRPDLTIYGISVTLQNNLQLNYKVDAKLMSFYEDFEIVVKRGEDEETISPAEYVEGDEYLSFALPNITPDSIGVATSAVLKATAIGHEGTIEAEAYTKTIKDYCYATLEQESEDDVLCTLIYNILTYCAATQKLVNSEIDDADLVTAGLSQEAVDYYENLSPAVETTSVLNKEYETVKNPKAAIKGCGLNLNDSVTMRFKIHVDNISDNVYVIIKNTNNGKQWKIGYKNGNMYEIGSEGDYLIYFNGLDASMFKDTLTITVYDKSNAISNTITYSVESYCDYLINNGTAAEKAIANQLMRYCESALSYVEE